mmetsp:Transcript_15491/g.33404  ORF Transcript_15491/g.33404 Transcript_15491/m.33404 type:complete len:353 (+) Transcript_15491:514-1572(+)
MYDIDVIRNKVGLNVHHFRTACSCFDYALTAKNPQNRQRLGPDWQKALYMDVDPSYSSTWREIHVHQSDQLAARNKQNFSFPEAWDLFPEERDRVKAGKAPSACGNRARCVFVPVHDILDIMKEMRPTLPARCNLVAAGKYRDEAETYFLPGKMLVEAARGMLPSHFKAEKTLIVHLRYEMGEYSRERELCQNDKTVCWGRSHEYNVLDIPEFGRLVMQQARALNCTHVFPILPRQFMSDGLVGAIAAQFGLRLNQLVSSRDLLDVNIMLFERTLAVICQGLVAETKKTSFAATIANQRRGLELPHVVPIETVLAGSSVSVNALRSKHGDWFGAMFKEISEAAERAKRTVKA